ncbi:hypothetical protein ScPMuIL_006095 [Solemya velum]
MCRGSGDGRLGIDDSSTETVVNQEKQRFTLPSFRYTNIVLGIIFIDGLVSVILWLTGGTSEYFVDNIVHFHLRESVFDLALIAAIKVTLFPCLLALLETASYRQIDNPYVDKFQTRARVLHISLILSSVVFLAYSTTKGGLILYSILNENDYVKMHTEYNALVIWAVCFSILEFLSALASYSGMRKLKIIRILHKYNDKGEEIDEKGEPIKQGANIKRLFKLAKPEAGILMVATFCLFISSGCQMVSPLFFGKVVDSAMKSLDELSNTVLILVGIYILNAISAFLRGWLFTLSGHRFVARLRKHMFSTILKQEVAFFDTSRTGELCNRLSSDTQVLQNTVTVNISMLARYTLDMIGCLSFMFYLNPALTGVLLSVIPVVSLGAVQYGKFLKKLSKDFQDHLADGGTQAEECISSIRTVRSFTGEEKATSAYSVEIDKSYATGKKLAFAYGAFQGIIGLLVYGAIALALWYGGKLVHMLLSLSFQALYLYCLVSFQCIALVFQAVGASVRLFEIFDRIPKVPNENGVMLASLEGRVNFKDVHFTYPSRPDNVVLKGVTFNVNPGQMVALVGPSGGGKSTIVNMIERFYDPDDGMITLGGMDLKTLDPQWFRRRIAMVSQEPTLFACSIKDNIAYGKNATIEEVMEAAKQANAHEFISSFEEGYDTMVGERGVRLSGGQKQRVAIARALIMDPVILLLDEATSALDAESEHLVQEAVDRAMSGRTVLVIAHRLSTVRNASQVIVIDKGCIAEKGTHDELISKDGVYKRLVLRQLTAGAPLLHGDPSLTEQNSINYDTQINDKL